jgi:phosphoenolpyruvate---glycerone phosphotransferase subunit DhaL
MDAEVFRAWIVSAAGVIEANRDHLTQLDAAIGDADHGINLARGFTAVLVALDAPGAKTATPGAILTVTGNTLISKVGGASGPLYGTAFRRARAASGCPCWPGPTRRCWPPRPVTMRSSTPPRVS